jgi:pyruvate/2-oxoglutarate dehydrogenase complex dihydrolipoamide acyltransferase (E2) component
MRDPIHVPDLGDEAPALNLWIVAPGDHVYAGDRLAELLLDEATIDVTAPVTGRLVERNVRPGQIVTRGQILGWIES